MNIPAIRTRTTTLLILSAAVALAACGDDDDTASASAYCERSAELSSIDGVPADKDLEALLDSAPGEIRDDVQTLVDALQSGDVGNDDILEAEAAVTAYEEAHCGGDLADASGDDGGADESAAPAVVTFTSPANGDTVSNPVVVEANAVNVEIAPAGESGDGQGHLHVLIDTECLTTGDVIPQDDDHVHFGDGSTTLELPELEPGEHDLCLQLGDGEHRAFGAASTITVDVES